MKRTDLIQSVLKHAPNLSRKEAQNIVDTILERMSKALVKGEDIFLRGFGTFQTYKGKERSGRNISTGERLYIPACRKVKFRMSKYLRYRINGEI